MTSRAVRLYIYDPGADPTLAEGDAEREEALDTEASTHLEALKELVREAGGDVDRLMPPICSGADLAWLLSLVSDVFGAGAGLYLVGTKIRAFLTGKNRRRQLTTGDGPTLRPVAYAFLVDRVPHAQIDLERVESIAPSYDGPAIAISRVYLYRFRDLQQRIVYTIEVSSGGELISFAERPFCSADDLTGHLEREARARALMDD